MEFSLGSENISQFEADALVTFTSQSTGKKSGARHQTSHPEARDYLEKAIADDIVKGTFKESRLFRYALTENTQDLFAIGTGNKPSAEDMRELGAITARALKANSVHSAAIDFKSLQLKSNIDGYLEAFCEGIHLGLYEFDSFKSQKKEPEHELESIEIYLNNNATLRKAIERAEITAEWVNFSRHLGDSPGNKMTPTILAEQVREAAKGSALKVTIWDRAKLEKERMGGILGVAAGSSEDPCLIIMEYKGAAASKKPACFVGKGLTFDAGGICIKPAAKMDEMKYDMCGGANVIGAMLGIAHLKLKTNAIGIVAASENLLGASATKPGDVLTFRNGKTAEILNTDAEGRLILADALSLASEKKPAFICDAATLTGAMVVALGNIYTGFFTRDDKFAAKVSKAAKTTGEKVWNMPLAPEHTKDLSSPVADLRNIGKTGGAGSSTAAAFLSEFVSPDIPWAHFDIAGTGWHCSDRLSYVPKQGATGAMVRTFIEMAK